MATVSRYRIATSLIRPRPASKRTLRIFTTSSFDRTSFSSSPNSERHSTTTPPPESPSTASSPSESQFLLHLREKHQVLLYTNPFLSTIIKRLWLPLSVISLATPPPFLWTPLLLTPLALLAKRRLEAVTTPASTAHVLSDPKKSSQAQRLNSSFLTEGNEILTPKTPGKLDPETPITLHSTTVLGNRISTVTTGASLRAISGPFGFGKWLKVDQSPMTGAGGVSAAVGGSGIGLGGIGESNRGEKERDGVAEDIVAAVTKDRKGNELGRLELGLKDPKKGLETVKIGAPVFEWWVRKSELAKLKDKGVFGVTVPA